MEDYSRSMTFDFQKQLNQRDLEHLKTRLVKVVGVESFDITPDSLRVEYVPFLIAEDSITGIIRQTGFPVKTGEKKKGVIRKFLDKLVKSNRETFGNKKPDCCNLNRT